jgi:hypothetical protein
MRIHYRGLARQLSDVGGEFAALRIRMNDPFMAEAVATDYPHFAREKDEDAGAETSRAIERFTFGVVTQAAEATHPVDFRRRENRKHLLVSGMITYAHVFGYVVVIGGRSVSRR